MPTDLDSLSWTDVESANIKSLAHDPFDDTLYVRFTNDSVYAYDGVPADQADAMASAESVGKFFHASIKNAYPYRRVS